MCGNEAESSTWAASRRRDDSTTFRGCVACGTKIHVTESFKTPCGHIYCIACLSILFELATTDETMFPPRCCRQHIPLTSVKLYIDNALYTKFKFKSVEFSATDRIYCFAPFCSAFITSAEAGIDVVTCMQCYQFTCTICKNKAHGGDCPGDTHTQMLLEVANHEGWQRCDGCQRVIELGSGCNHITYAHSFPLNGRFVANPCHSCPCGKEFW